MTAWIWKLAAIHFPCTISCRTMDLKDLVSSVRFRIVRLNIGRGRRSFHSGFSAIFDLSSNWKGRAWFESIGFALRLLWHSGLCWSHPLLAFVGAIHYPRSVQDFAQRRAAKKPSLLLEAFHVGGFCWGRRSSLNGALPVFMLSDSTFLND